MRFKELIDLFETTYKIECLKNSVKEIALNKKMEAYWVSLAVQDILREVKELESHVGLDTLPNTYNYVLPDDFGFVINVKQNGKELQVTSRDEINSNPYKLPQATKFAVYSDGKNQIIFNGTISDIRVRYYIATFLYSPSGTQLQSIGTFDGYNASGDIVIVDYYINPIIQFMLAQLFNDRQQEYLFELQKLRQNRVASAPDRTAYQLG